MARERFCAVVNEGLTRYEMGFTYDCTHLDIEQKFPEPELDGDVSCKSDIVEPASKVVRREFPTCERSVIRVWENRAVDEIRQSGKCGGSPLVLDLDGDGARLRSVREGVRFDLLANGRAVRTGWVGPGDGLLVLDRDGNGWIDDATELFGERTAGRHYAHGFQPLSELDDDGDRQIDANDRAWSSLRVWVDRDADGQGPASEWLTLEQAGVAALSVDSWRVSGSRAAAGHGNRIPWVGHFVRADGTRGALVDVFFAYEPAEPLRFAAACWATGTP